MSGKKSTYVQGIMKSMLMLLQKRRNYMLQHVLKEAFSSSHGVLY